jgi:hypothetical protein
MLQHLVEVLGDSLLGLNMFANMQNCLQGHPHMLKHVRYLGTGTGTISWP